MTSPSDEAHIARLAALIARQEQELEQLRGTAAARSLTDLARGMLMERLGCTPAEAQDQLTRLSQQAGTGRIELAAQITSQDPVPDLPVPEITADPKMSLTRAAVELSTDGPGMAAALLESLAPAGAGAVAIWLLAPDGGLDLAGEAGLGPGEASRWRRIPPGLNVAAQQAAENGAEVWWPAGQPGTNPIGPLAGRWPGGARAVLPLHSPGMPGAGTVLGALEACWPEPLPGFPAALQRQLAALARVTAETLGGRADGPRPPGYDLSWLFGLLEGVQESVLFAQAIRDASGTVTDFRIEQVSRGFRDPAGRTGGTLRGRSLIAAYPAAARPGNLLDLALRVHGSGQPAQLSGELVAGAASPPFQHVRMARLFDGVVIAWRPAADIEGLAALLEHAQRLGRIGGWEENMVTGAVRWTEPTFTLFGKQPGQPVPLTELHRRVAADDVPAVRAFQHALLVRKTAAATAFRIVRADDGSLRQIRAFAEPVSDPAGTLLAVRGAYQDVSAQYHTEAALAATRDQLASSEERAAEERRLAVHLQQAIIPLSANLTETAGLDVAARYRPAARDQLVSGDWYDTVLLPAGHVLLAIGDIAGHGIGAVTGMVSLRNGLRALAVTGAGPVALLSWLNQAAYHLTTDMATALCGLYDPQTRTLRWARAGHLPPVLVRDSTAVQLAEPRGALLGADPESVYEEVTTSLQPGDTLLLFTDGLIERRTQTIDEATQAFLAIATQPAGAASELADALLTSACSDTGDDACLMAVRVY